MLGVIRKALFGVSDDEMSFDRLGFRTEPEQRNYLENVTRTFVNGYHAALAAENNETLQYELECVELRDRGFAYEGAAMGAFLLDLLAPWKRRGFDHLLDGRGRAHIYMIHVGAGWAIARLHYPLARALSRLDPLLRWLAVDGYGFHEGFFRRHRVLARADRPAFSGYAGRAFDQGFGRSLWFVEGCSAERIHETIARFPEDRRADLWSGVGLACAYAAGVPDHEIHLLADMAASYISHLGQGAAFAAAARERAGNRAPHTDRACAILCGMSAADAALLTERATPHDREELAYEAWRGEVREKLPHAMRSSA